MAGIIDRDTSLVSKVESGEVRLQFRHAELIDAVWKTGGLLARIVALAQSRHDGEWGVERVERERESDRLSIWSLGWVPALTQTPEYARASFLGAGIPDVDEEVDKRIVRQGVLDQASVRILVAQSALEESVGGPEIQRAQLARLLELAAHHSIRVVPHGAGAHPGRDGSFTIYSRGGRDTAVWTETLGKGRLVSDASEVTSYRVWFDRIGDRSLPLDASTSLIRNLVEE